MVHKIKLMYLLSELESHILYFILYDIYMYAEYMIFCIQIVIIIPKLIILVSFYIFTGSLDKCP